MKEQLNIRISKHTKSQLVKLCEVLNLNQTEVILLAVERLNVQIVGVK